MNAMEGSAGPAPETRAETSFVPRLESVRGFAAFMVAGWHSFAVLDLTGWQSYGREWVRFFFNGIAAVTLFFVLSGVVLGGSLARSRGPSWLVYLTFAVRRVLRIWPAYVVTGLFILVMVRWVDVRMAYPHGVDSWFAGHWSEPVTAQLVLRHLFFLNQSFNPPSWTLRAEMVCSLALPALFFMSRKAGGLGRGLIMAALMWVSARGLFPELSRGAHWSHSLLVTWIFAFYLGLLVPDLGRRFMGSIKNNRWAWLIAPAAWMALILVGGDDWAHVAEGVAGAIFISALLYGPEWSWFKVLDWPVARFYGRISYSFYLYHMISLYLVAKFAMRLVPVSSMIHFGLLTGAIFLAGSTAVATLLAWASNCWVEKPAISLGRRICGALNGKATPNTELRTPKSERNPEPEARITV